MIEGTFQLLDHAEYFLYKSPVLLNNAQIGNAIKIPLLYGPQRLGGPSHKKQLFIFSHLHSSTCLVLHSQHEVRMYCVSS